MFAVVPQSATFPPIAGAHPAASIRRMRLAVIIAGFCAFLQLYATQPLLPYLRKVFLESEMRVSLTVSAATIAVALASPLIGILADTLGRKRIVIPALLFLSLPTVLAATSATLNQLIFWRFLQGLAVPGIVAVTLAYISEEAPANITGSITAGYVTGTVAGGLTGRFTCALVASQFGWRTSFVVLGALTFTGALATWFLMPRSSRFIRNSDPLAPLRAIKTHLQNPRLLATYFAGFNVLFTLVGMFTYANFHLAAPPFNLSTVALGMVFTVYALGVIITPLSGKWIDRLGCRTAMIAASVITVAGVLLTLLPNLPGFTAGLAVLSTGVFISQSTASSHIGAVTTSHRSAAAGLYVFFYYLGGSAGAAILGVAWKLGHWPACVACVLVAQALVTLAAWRYFASKTTLPSNPVPPAQALIDLEIQ